MKTLMKNIALAIILFTGVNAFSQAANTTNKCTAHCAFGSCTASCGGGAGGAACGCIMGFPACGCGGGVSTPVTANTHQLENVNELIIHLQTFPSPEGVNLKNKVAQYKQALAVGETNVSGLIQEIIQSCNALNPLEKQDYNNFVLTLIP